MTATPHLALPLVASNQAQKHVTVNEALTALDALVQLGVLDRDRTAPPGAPAPGDRYIVAPDPVGAWAGRAGEVALWADGAWRFFPPRPGWLAFVATEGALLAFDGAAWVEALGTVTALQNLALLGLGTAADAANPFATKLNKALWTARTAAEGGDGDLRCTLNKETPADVLSLLFQTGFSGRAELGLVGDDDLTLKVSPDGVAWTTALRLDGATGGLGLGVAPTTPLDVGSGAAPFATAVKIRASTHATSRRAGLELGSWLLFQDATGTGSLDVGLYSIAADRIRFRIDLTGHVLPGADNAQALGDAGARWSTVYAGTGAISTSDERLKDLRGAPDEPELRAWGRVGARLFRFADALAAKGEAARLHLGYLAQEVATAFAAEGLDPARYGLWCRDALDGPEDGAAPERLGLRYDQCLVLEGAYLRDRVARLETRLAALEDGAA